MKNITRFLALGLTATIMLGSFTACNAKVKANVNVNGSEVINTVISTGSWKIDELNKVSVEHKKIYEEAVSQLDGYFYEPVALLGTQIVSGTNYAFVSQPTSGGKSAMNSLVITYINVDPSGKASFISDERIVLPGTETDNGTIAGGWSYVESAEVTTRIKEMFEGMESYDGGPVYMPIANVGTQVVSGTNYAILCKTAPSHSEMNDKAKLVLVYVYENLQGACEITNTETIELSID